MDKSMEVTVQDYEARAMSLEADVHVLAVTDKESYDAMLELMDVARKFQKEIREFFAPMKKAAHDAHRTICTKETETLKPYVMAEKLSKRLAGDWYLEERRKADEEARKERERLAAEEEKKKAARVEKLREVGEPEAAERVEEHEVVVAPVKAVNQAAGSGFTMVDRWKARVIDVAKVPREYLVPDMIALGRLARENKGENPPAGVEFYNEPYGAKR